MAAKNVMELNRLIGVVVLCSTSVLASAEAEDAKPTVRTKTVNDRVIQSGTDSFIMLHEEITPVHVPPGAPGADSPFATNRPALRLLMVTGKGGWAGKRVGGYRGPVYIVPNFPRAAIDRTNVVEVLCTSDKTTIAVLVLDNGPLFYSTNSGSSWTTFSAPGRYELPLTDIEQDGGLIAATTIRSVTNSLPRRQIEPSKIHWYAVVSGAGGSELVLNGSATPSAPILSIQRSEGQVILVWPSMFSGFTVQQSADLKSESWAEVTNAVHSSPGLNQVIISTAGSNNYYRLQSR